MKIFVAVVGIAGTQFWTGAFLGCSSLSGIGFGQGGGIGKKSL